MWIIAVEYNEYLIIKHLYANEKNVNFDFSFSWIETLELPSRNGFIIACVIPKTHTGYKANSLTHIHTHTLATTI